MHVCEFTAVWLQMCGGFQTNARVLSDEDQGQKEREEETSSSNTHIGGHFYCLCSSAIVTSLRIWECRYLSEVKPFCLQLQFRGLTQVVL